MSNKTYIAIKNLPFGIKKDDIFYYNTESNEYCYNNTLVTIPYDCDKEIDFFKLVKASEKFKKYDIVTTGKDYKSIIKFTPLSIVSGIIEQKGKKTYLEVSHGNNQLLKDFIQEEDLIFYEEYYFINSSRATHKIIKGRFPDVDIWREATNNMFTTYDKAIEYRDNILQNFKKKN